jgi:predicted short-subunit dehydrogenase-like oxidoreductase (DUF2520 family)
MVGSGNAATVIGRLVKKAGHDIIQVVSRNRAHAGVLAAELGCAFDNVNIAIDGTADLYIIAVSDGALYELNTQFHLGNKMVVHTAGSVSIDVLATISHNYGVLYPLQSLRKEMDTATGIPLLIDANSAEAFTLLEDFARTLSPMVAKASDEERLKLHVAAVIVSNFTNHLYVMAEDFCKNENVDFAMLVPLIKETALRVEAHLPSTVQTGPAMRNDMITIEKHLRLLENYKTLKYIYLKLSDSIMNR